MNGKRRVSMFIVVMMVLTMSTFFVGCGKAVADESVTGASKSEYEKMTIKLGGTVPESHPITRAQYLFEKIVEEESGGAMQVEVYPNAQLGTGREMVEAVQIGDTSTAPFSSWTSEFSLLSLPFLFENREHAFEVVDSEMGKQMTDNVAELTGVRVIRFWENGIRNLSNGKKPIRSPKDLNGMKIRVMENPLYLNLFAAIGANPMPMAFGELYTALQQKTIDGQDNPYAIFGTNKFYEVQPHYTELGHVFDFTVLMFNEEWYQSLGDKEKALIDKAADEATKYQRAEAIKYELEAKKIVEDAGVEIQVLTSEEREVFKEASRSVYDWFREECDSITEIDYFLGQVESLR